VYKLKELQWTLGGDLKNRRGITCSAGVPLLAGRAGGEELAAVTTFPTTHLIREKKLLRELKKKIFKESLSTHRGKSWSGGSEYLPKLC